MRYALVVCFMVLLAGCDIIRDQLDGNQPPVIDTFEADPAEGTAPLVTGFSWIVADVEGEVLTCVLTFGDGQTAEVENCAEVSNQFHEYRAAGGLVAVLQVSDGTSSTSKSVAVRVSDADEEELDSHVRN